LIPKKHLSGERKIFALRRILLTAPGDISPIPQTRFCGLSRFPAGTLRCRACRKGATAERNVWHYGELATLLDVLQRHLHMDLVLGIEAAPGRGLKRDLGRGSRQAHSNCCAQVSLTHQYF
jgi:hypothetical protein